MRKTILMLGVLLITLAATAVGFIGWDNKELKKEESASCNPAIVFNRDFRKIEYIPAIPEFVYKVDSRFNTTIAKSKLMQAKSIIDILPKEATKTKKDYKNVRVTMLHENQCAKAYVGETELLSTAQLALLATADYDSNIKLEANCKERNPVTGTLEDYHLVYFITVVPTKEARVREGYDVLIEYLKENSKEEITIVEREWLQPGKMNFMVTKEGTITNVNLEYSSGYPSIDKAFLKLIAEMPHEWEPAQNEKGEKVDQELIFFFGLEGC